ncbi:hypothetical protein AGMMS50256_29380 [Betaproteobacteria bacterium]|nr:hypothetical protein AGMMS50256_29380 [Betaproteobacteria bacterium]
MNYHVPNNADAPFLITQAAYTVDEGHGQWVEAGMLRGELFGQLLQVVYTIQGL